MRIVRTHGYRPAPQEIPEGALRRDRRARPALGARPGARADVRLRDREAARAGRGGRARRQAERSLSGPSQPPRRRPARQPRRALGRRSAAPLLRDHPRRASRARRLDRRMERDARLRRRRAERKNEMTTPTLTSIALYLAQVRDALGDADPALVQDALYDAEEYLRSELAENPGVDEATVVARVARSYGAPEEVAEIYRDTEAKVAKALRTPSAPPRRSALGRFFGVIADPRAYAGLFYMVLALATGIAYFTVAVTGVSLSAGLSILIIGVPFAILFVGIVRLLSLVEGRIVETLLGVRMPRRPLYNDRGKP